MNNETKGQFEDVGKAIDEVGEAVDEVVDESKEAVVWPARTCGRRSTTSTRESANFEDAPTNETVDDSS